MAEEKGSSKKVASLIEEIGKLSVLELAELVKGLEEKFGVQPMAAAPIASGQAASQQQSQEEDQASEKATVDVILTDAGANKIAVIKALREIKPDLGLKEAKDLSEQTPAEVLVGVKKEQAEEAKKKLEEAGAKVELK